MDFKQLAAHFVDLYYKGYNAHLKQGEESQIQRPNLADLYRDTSLLTNQDQEYVGVQLIMKYLLENLKFHAKDPVNFSAQPSVGNSILICVQGDSFFVDMDPPQRLPFTEVFLITMNEQQNGFIIHNQIFSCQGV